MTEMAMASGCCVCSDERGWAENPLVYCDGEGCNIGVHKACYGITHVPSGNWYCRKCESQERSARVKCELCPTKDGAFKRTECGSWAHVVCALYIPEVRFGDVTTMEPIELGLIPQDRFNKPCYICEKNSRGNKASSGACMTCNKNGCKLQFHVTCALSLGLLCEEPGNYYDNVKYCGYCEEHFMKLKKVPNVKSATPLKGNPETDESVDKKSSNHNQTAADLKQSHKRKSITNKAQNGSSKGPLADRKENQINGIQNMSSPLQLTVNNFEISVNSNGDQLLQQQPPLPPPAGKSDSMCAGSRFTLSSSSNFVALPESANNLSDNLLNDIHKMKKRRINATNSMSPTPSLDSPKSNSVITSAELEGGGNNGSADNSINKNDQENEKGPLDFSEENIKLEPEQSKGPENSPSITLNDKGTSSSTVISSTKTSTFFPIPTVVQQKAAHLNSTDKNSSPHNESKSTATTPVSNTPYLTTSASGMPEMKIPKYDYY